MLSCQRIAAVVLVALVALTSTAIADQDFRGQIQPNEELAQLMNLGPNTRVLLHAIPPESAATTTDSRDKVVADSIATETKQSLDLSAFGQHRDRSTLVAIDGSFIFRDLQQGAYTLELVSRTHSFQKYRIDILDPALGKAPQIRIFTPGTSLVSIRSSNLIFHPLILHAVKRVDYYTEAAPLTISSLLGMGGPMMLLPLAAMGMIFILPKLTASLDPEAQKELAESQKRMQKRMAAVQSGDMSGLLSGDEKKGQDKNSNSARAQRK
ncbi:protein of unknown function DUF2012 [Kalmanozyma brasiliensis GHG001]|uniref:ER membrane protein complex subunit 7 beta-sandwich domain-containing protein n=1 Tax=Kalmanozyma brasiliensis (strain GHG001) TaxID=1365824 RepID=V5E994_KALBG|nr:protein of unknown function DUF2012 [Kalmanozyma brasiliensis GHG001]EST06926.1 protein of unknown function DUF2012 [Kalmanozyma brasiliensis GHG001]